MVDDRGLHMPLLTLSGRGPCGLMVACARGYAVKQVRILDRKNLSEISLSYEFDLSGCTNEEVRLVVGSSQSDLEKFGVSVIKDIRNKENG